MTASCLLSRMVWIVEAQKTLCGNSSMCKYVKGTCGWKAWPRNGVSQLP